MRFLHTADFHIGIVVHGRSMLPDQAHILQQIVSIAKEERPDALLIAGDIYDKPQPPVEAVGLFDRFLTDLAEAGQTVILVGGNHDSPERLGFAGEILRRHNILTPGGYTGTLRRHIMNDCHGPVHIHMLPFIRPALIRRLFPHKDIPGYNQAMCAVLENVQFDPSARHVLVGHQYITAPGFVPDFGEETLFVGGAEWIDVSRLAPFDYAALGHMHLAQYVARDTVRFSGSPLKYSVNECRGEKSVTLVDMGPKGEVSVRLRPLVPLRDMRTIKGPLEALTDPQTIGAANPEDYIHAQLTNQEEIIDAWGKLKSVYPNLLTLNFERTRMTEEGDLSEDMPVEQLEPEVLFARFFARHNGMEPSATIAERFSELLETVSRPAVDRYYSTN